VEHVGGNAKVGGVGGSAVATDHAHALRLESAIGVHVLASRPEFVRRGGELFVREGDLAGADGLCVVEGGQVPRTVEFREALPLTAPGKVSKDPLR